MSATKDLTRSARKDTDADKESFFDSTDSSQSSPSAARGRRQKPRRTNRRMKKEKNVDAEGKELKNLLRMTDLSPISRSESCGSEEEEEQREQQELLEKVEEGCRGGEKRKKNSAKGKKSEMSLLDCLCAPEGSEEGSSPEPGMPERVKDFLSVMNNEMKSVFLQSSEESGGSIDEESEKEACAEDAEEKPLRKIEDEIEVRKRKSESGRQDELRRFRFPATSSGDEADKSGSRMTKKNGEAMVVSDEDSCCSVEYVEQVRNKAQVGKGDSKSEPTSGADSGSDIQQVYCETQSPSKGRKNINKILKKENLQMETKQALKMETERKRRVSERMKIFENLFPGDDSKLVLDFDPATKEELVVVNSNLSGQLKPHQREGVRFMWNCCFESLKRLEEDSGSGCVLAHCMGLGKTLQVITLVHTVLTQNTGVHTVMIMCPLNTLRNWAHEFKTWQRGCERKIRPVDLIPCRTKHGRMLRVRGWCQQGGVLLISYEMFRTLIRKGESAFVRGFLDPGPDLVVCDEGHVLKNEGTALSKSMSGMKTLRRIILTGTPLQNNLIEYYCMVQFVKPNILGTKKEFMNRFVNPINNGQFEDSTQLDVRLMKRRAHVLHTMLDGFIQRRGYYVLRPFLPEKQEYVISIALTETQENIYRLLINRYSGDCRGLLRDFHWMQKVWTHPRVLLMNSKRNQNMNADPEPWEKFVREEEHDSIESSGKLLLLFGILKRCKEIGDKVLVFSQSLYSLDLIEYFLQKANSYYCAGVDLEFAERWVLGQDYFRLDGSTSSDNRDAYCQGFNNIENGGARLFLISTRAGGVGINLVAANRVVLFDASWNPTQDVQSIFRVYRFGQKKVCYIYRFLAAATMEEKIYKRQVTKLSLAHRILDEHQIERHYTMGNLQELYRYDPVPKNEWRVSKIPKDSLFADILANNRDIIVGYHEHDSLLENKEEEELTEEERRAAWEDYEKEKLIPDHPRVLLNGNSVPIAPATQRMTVHWLNSEGLKAGPGMYTPPVPQSGLISQGGSDLCKIVDVRTLSGEGGMPGRLRKLLEFGEAFGLKQGEGEGFQMYCERLLTAFRTVFPWGSSGSIVRDDVSVNGFHGGVMR